MVDVSNTLPDKGKQVYALRRCAHENTGMEGPSNGRVEAGSPLCEFTGHEPVLVWAGDKSKQARKQEGGSPQRLRAFKCHEPAHQIPAHGRSRRAVRAPDALPAQVPVEEREQARADSVVRDHQARDSLVRPRD